MKRLKHLREERARIEGEMRSIFAKCETENRSRTTEEVTKYNGYRAEVEAINIEIKDLEEFEAQEARSAKPVNGGEKEDGSKSNPEERSNGPVTIRSQVESWMTRNADLINDIRKNGSKRDLPVLELEYRAANSPMTPANTATNTIAISAIPALQGGAPYVDLLRRRPNLWNLIPKGRTGQETYTWVNKKVPANSGAADFIAPGTSKPPVSWTMEVEKSNAKKPAVSTKVATELLDDVDGMVSKIEGELSYQLADHINSILMGAAVATSTDPAGIRSFANAFTTVGLATQNPNNWDCARSLIAQMRLAYVESNILILMNPVDTANMDMSKAISQGTYLGLEMRPIPGGYIVEDTNVPAGGIYGIAIEYLETLIYKDFKVAFGWENDDFTKNLVTAIAEMRFHSFHSDNHANGFIYDELADIKTSIAIP